MNAETNTNREIIPNLLPEEALLLSKLLEPVAKLAREAVSVSRHPLQREITLRINGELKVGEDYQQRIVQKASPWGLVHVLLEELRQLSLAAPGGGVNLDALVRRAMVCDEHLEKAAQERANKIAAALKEETLQPCRGKTTASGRLDVLVVQR